MLDRIIAYSFYLLFFLTPLIWTPLNYELFEYNKMLVVYFLTVAILCCWILKMIQRKAVIFHRTPLQIPLLLFLGANILSTIFSIDVHTSIWGYYSRLNGGLVSIISYTILYFALVSNFDKEKILKLMKVGLLGGLFVSLWAIPEHFGISPSCVILRGEFNAACWIQDVQARVFATLGQPNWLAAYLAMLIFPALYFLLTATKKSLYIIHFTLLIIFYLAFTFTYSRGATIGLIIAFAVLIGFQILRFHPKGVHINLRDLKPMLIVLVTFILINIIFGSALTRFQLSNLLPKSPSQTQPTSSTLTQLETGGTESSQIRIIVWQGAVEIFKHYPIFGSGVETFAYSYYQFRPAAHNLVSEWDFLYNKAHNEFLNYLATTGIVGFGTYMLVIITFIGWATARIFNLQFFIFHKNFKFQISNSKTKQTDTLLIIVLLASYISYLIQNIFGFSVVTIALFFFLFPALAFVATDSTKSLKLPKLLTYHLSLITLIYRRPIYTKIAKGIIILSTIYLLFSIIKLWYADTLFAEGLRNSEQGNAGRAYNLLSDAIRLNNAEPYYLSELGYAAAAASLATKDQDATLSAHLKDQAIYETNLTLAQSPKNVSFWRTAIRTYYELSGIDKSYTQKTLAALDQAINLAPTDPKLYYNKAVILGQIDRNDEAIKILQKAVLLKPNYRESYFALALFYFDQGQKEKAIATMNKVLQLVPNDPEALDKLKEWGT